jgi:hypothetical protein
MEKSRDCPFHAPVTLFLEKDPQYPSNMRFIGPHRYSERREEDTTNILTVNMSLCLIKLHA